MGGFVLFQVAPLFPLLGFLIAGILVAKVFSLSYVVWWLGVGCFLLSTFWRSLKFWPIFMVIFCFGGLRYTLVHSDILADPFKELDNKTVDVRFEPLEKPVHRNDHFSFLARADKTLLLVDSPREFFPSTYVWAKGSLEKLPRKLGFYHEKGCHHRFHLIKVFKIVQQENRWSKIRKIVRLSFEQWLARSLSPQEGAVASGILFGDHRKIPKDLLDDFRVTGTYHLLVASGLKVALVAGGIWWMSQLFSFQIRVLVAVFGVLFYGLLVGPEPPLLRAVLMILLGYSSIALGRGEENIGGIFLAAFSLLFWNPLWLFDVGFQLSFLSVFGIFAFFPLFSERLSFLPRLVRDSIGITLSAQLPVLIPLALNFHVISFISPLANLLTVPLTGAVLFFAVASFLVGLVFKPFGFILASWNHGLLLLMVWVVQKTSRIPLAYRFVQSPSLLTSVAVYLFLISLKCLKQKWGKTYFLASFVLLCGIWIFNFWKTPEARIVFLDVGQGDSTLLFIGHKTFLVDGGGSLSEIKPDGFSVGENILVPELESYGVNHFDGIFLTHPHADHVGGLLAVLRRFPVKQIWLPSLETSSPIYKAFLSEAQKKKIPIRFVLGDKAIQLSSQARMNLFWPIPPLLHGTHSDLNNNSMVSQLVLGKVKVLLAGDVELEGEQALLGHVHPKSLLQSSILKVPHHGSRTSSSESFLKAVSPYVAVVSVGEKNRYGHPSMATLRRIRRHAPYLFRTDQDGTVDYEICETNGPLASRLRANK